MTDELPTDAPLLRVVAGSPTPEELAALTVVLAAASGDGMVEQPRRLDRWSAPGHRLRPWSGHGFGAWRGSGLPR